jgi:hypothetical protein
MQTTSNTAFSTTYCDGASASGQVREGAQAEQEQRQGCRRHPAHLAALPAIAPALAARNQAAGSTSGQLRLLVRN